MHEENLLQRPKKRFVATTNSDHRLAACLFKRCDGDGCDRTRLALVVADLTYIRLGCGSFTQVPGAGAGGLP